jgi:hypothetical protein
MILRVYDDTKGRGRCSGCDAPLYWYEQTNGKKHPFNAEAVYVLTEHDILDHRLIGHIDTSVTISHFATCPQVGQFRRAR